MMKLSTMKKVVTLDGDKRQDFVERMLSPWGCDPGTAKFFRASANFVFLFKKDGQSYFLRFNDSCERELSTIQAEVEILEYLSTTPVRIAQPVKSLNGKFVETVQTEIGIFYAVVFTALGGQQYEFAEIKHEDFAAWGRALGELHERFKAMPDICGAGRPSWRDNLNFVREMLTPEDVTTWQELDEVLRWAESLPVSRENFGMIHYDFESDNLCWQDGVIAALDFDDCARYWYVADIAYALRDLFEDGIDLQNPQFLQFMEGYTQATEVDQALLKDLPWFMRMHNLMMFARLVRSVDISEDGGHPEWLLELRKKLLRYIEKCRTLCISNQNIGGNY